MAGIFGVSLAIFVPKVAGVQAPMLPFDQVSTEERLRQPGFWPTKAAKSRKDFVGSAACLQCHSSLAAQLDTPMARTMRRGADSDRLRAHVGEQFQLGPFHYQINRSLDGYQFSAGASAAPGLPVTGAPLSWVFGFGITGQSYLFSLAGEIYESRFSFFDGINGFDFTPGRPHLPHGSAKDALGRRLSAVEARGCFACHATGLTEGQIVDPSDLIPGVTCEACHGPGANHVAAKRAGLDGVSGRIFIPWGLSAGDRNDFCGSCHRAFWDVALAGTRGVSTVLFQPYRIESSKCWGTGKGDVRLTCTSCHNPHAPRARDAGYYDPKCLSCHSAGRDASPSASHPGKPCPVSPKNCISCHMPKYELPEMHYKFTDHKIRIVAKDGSFVD